MKKMLATAFCAAILLSAAPARGAAPLAYPSTQEVEVDGVKVEFQMYALKDENGYDTNYVKLRDAALALDTTQARFQVTWDQTAGAIRVITGTPYTPDGTEMSTPFSGVRTYEAATSAVVVDGKTADLSGILLKDDRGNGYTYFKLRDLGAALGFKVDWSADRGVYVETAPGIALNPSAGDTPSLSYEEELMRTMVLKVNNQTMTFQQFLPYLFDCMADIEQQFAQQGMTVDWYGDNGVTDQNGDPVDLTDYCKRSAREDAIYDMISMQMCGAYNVTSVDQLAAAVFPTLSESDIRSTFYCAKHILVRTEAEASAILADLMANPSMIHFNQLLNTYNLDPGMSSNPNGYLFTSGEMLPEFENAVKALGFGKVTSAPVKTDVGYHIILKLDPVTHPDALSSCRSMKLDGMMNTWRGEATVSVNEAELNRLNAADRYLAAKAATGLS